MIMYCHNRHILHLVGKGFIFHFLLNSQILYIYGRVCWHSFSFWYMNFNISYRYHVFLIFYQFLAGIWMLLSNSSFQSFNSEWRITFKLPLSDSITRPLVKRQDFWVWKVIVYFFIFSLTHPLKTWHALNWIYVWTFTKIIEANQFSNKQG